MTCILVTAAGGTLAPLNIRLLRESRRHAVTVVAVDSRPEAAGKDFADHFSVVPPANDPGYVSAIVTLIQRYGVTIVLPWSDEEAITLATHRETIEQTGALLACADLWSLHTMSNKATSMRHLSAHGIRIPKWHIVESVDSLQRDIDKAMHDNAELVIKPMQSRGGREVYVIRNDIVGQVDYYGSRECHTDWATFEKTYRQGVDAQLPVMMMERLFLPALDIDVLAWQGKLVQAVPRERLNPSGIPFRGSIFRDTDALTRIAQDVVASLNLSWLYDIDLMSDAHGNPVVIELNPRPSGSIAASIHAGIPFYEMLMDLAAGIVPSAVAIPEDGRRIVPYMDCSFPVGAQ